MEKIEKKIYIYIFFIVYLLFLMEILLKTYQPIDVSKLTFSKLILHTPESPLANGTSNYQYKTTTNRLRILTEPITLTEGLTYNQPWSKDRGYFRLSLLNNTDVNLQMLKNNIIEPIQNYLNTEICIKKKQW